MIEVLLPWAADALVLVGLVVLTLSVYGVLRLPNAATRIHAAAQASLMGVVPVLLGTMLGSDAAAVPKAVLIGAFLLLTSPIVAHEIGQATFLREHRGSPEE